MHSGVFCFFFKEILHVIKRNAGLLCAVTQMNLQSITLGERRQSRMWLIPFIGNAQNRQIKRQKIDYGCLRLGGGDYEWLQRIQGFFGMKLFKLDSVTVA